MAKKFEEPISSICYPKHKYSQAGFLYNTNNVINEIQMNNAF
jgi:hypothetical protein